jgi:dephospho-CoA kinase
MNGTERPYIIGLTGGIGSGKSAASRHFESLGIPVVDADVAARQVVEPGMPALKAIAKHFGPALITDAGTLDRSALRQRIFADPAEKAWLEQLLHPLIRQRIIAALMAANDRPDTGTAPYVLLVSPLLLETDQRELVDRVLLIDAPEHAQVERSMLRDDNTREQIEAIMNAQAPRAFKLEQADDIIYNDSDLIHLQQAVESMHQRFLKLARLKLATPEHDKRER